MRYTGSIVTALLVMFAGPLAAQLPDGGTLELGAFAQYTKFDDGSGCACRIPANSVGAGALVGYFMGGPLSLELEGTHTSADRLVTGGSMDVSTLAGRINFNIAPATLGGAWISAGLGPTFTRYEGADDRFGGSGAIAARYLVADQLALRLGGAADYFPSEGNVNLSVRGGISFMLDRAAR